MDKRGRRLPADDDCDASGGQGSRPPLSDGLGGRPADADVDVQTRDNPASGKLPQDSKSQEDLRLIELHIW